MEEWLIILLRTAGLFALIVLLVPFIGRKPLSSMTSLDYILGLVPAVMSGLIALNVIPNLAYGLLALFSWYLFILLVQYLVLKSKWVHDHIYGKEVVVIKNGKVMEENLHSARLTGEELLSQLRRKNVFQVADVEFAVMETNGDISTLVKRDKQPLTAKDMRMKVGPQSEPQTVLLDGKVLDEPLSTLGLNRKWLFDELDKTGILAENVFIGQVDQMGELYVDLFDDTLQVPQPSTKQLLLSTLKKAEADFLKYELETNNKEWKQKYQQHAKELKDVIQRLEPHLNT